MTDPRSSYELRFDESERIPRGGIQIPLRVIGEAMKLRYMKQINKVTNDASQFTPEEARVLNGLQDSSSVESIARLLVSRTFEISAGNPPQLKKILCLEKLNGSSGEPVDTKNIYFVDIPSDTQELPKDGTFVLFAPGSAWGYESTVENPTEVGIQKVFQFGRPYERLDRESYGDSNLVAVLHITPAEKGARRSFSVQVIEDQRDEKTVNGRLDTRGIAHVEGTYTLTLNGNTIESFEKPKR